MCVCVCVCVYIYIYIYIYICMYVCMYRISQKYVKSLLVLQNFTIARDELVQVFNV